MQTCSQGPLPGAELQPGHHLAKLSRCEGGWRWAFLFGGGGAAFQGGPSWGSFEGVLRRVLRRYGDRGSFNQVQMQWKKLQESLFPMPFGVGILMNCHTHKTASACFRGFEVMSPCLPCPHIHPSLSPPAIAVSFAGSALSSQVPIYLSGSWALKLH